MAGKEEPQQSDMQEQERELPMPEGKTDKERICTKHKADDSLKEERMYVLEVMSVLEAKSLSCSCFSRHLRQLSGDIQGCTCPEILVHLSRCLFEGCVCGYDLVT